MSIRDANPRLHQLARPKTIFRVDSSANPVVDFPDFRGLLLTDYEKCIAKSCNKTDLKNYIKNSGLENYSKTTAINNMVRP